MVNKLSNEINDYVKKSTLITGSARSGTTIVGTLLSSFEKVEYFFEPPTLFTLFANYNDSNKIVMDELISTYLFEDLLIQRLMGRNFNCNRYDDSSINNILTKEEFEKRINSTLRKKDIEKKAYSKSIIFKMPDIVPFVKNIDFLNDMRILRCKRNVSEQINSLMEKGWFLSVEDSGNQIWPNKYYGNKKYPFWLNENFYNIWYKCSNKERCFIYTAHMEINIESKYQYVINYDNLINDKYKVIEEISSFLKLKTTERTTQIADNIKVQKSTNRAKMTDISKEIIQLTNEYLAFDYIDQE